MINFSSIRFKLLGVFLLVISILCVVDIGLVVFHLVTIRSYNQIDDNIFMQFQLIGTTQDLIKSYNEVRNNTGIESMNKYRQKRDDIERIFSSLDTAITNAESKESLVGVKNTIRNVMSETDNGVKKIESGDITDTSVYYAEANRKFYFVRENTASLILKELEYAQVLQDKINTNHKTIMILVSALIVSVITGCLILSSKFAQKLIIPLIRLTTITKDVAAGNLDIAVDTALLKNPDEIGSLANSFNSMITNLKTIIQKLEESNAQLAATKGQIEGKNTELQRLNDVFVNRELKMIELKKTIADLEQKLKSNQNPPSTA